MRLTLDPDDPRGTHFAAWWFGLRHERFLDVEAGLRVGDPAWYDHYLSLVEELYEVGLDAAIEALSAVAPSRAGDERRAWEILHYRFGWTVADALVSRYVMLANAVRTFGHELLIDWAPVDGPVTSYRDLQTALASHRSRSSVWLAQLVASVVCDDVDRLKSLATVGSGHGRDRAAGIATPKAVVRSRRALRVLEARLAKAVRPGTDVLILPAHLSDADVSRAIPADQRVGRFPGFEDVLRDLAGPRRRPRPTAPTSATLHEASRIATVASIPDEVVHVIGARAGRCIEAALDRRVPPVLVAGFLPDAVAQRYVAEATTRGARLVMLQHGGTYGMVRHHLWGTVERRVADRFGAWGWAATSDDPRVFDLPMHRERPVEPPRVGIHRVHDRPRHDPPRILYVYAEWEPEAEGCVGLRRGPSAHEVAEEFITFLDPRFVEGVTFRERPATKGGRTTTPAWMEAHRVMRSDPGASLADELASTDVVVVDSTVTTVCLDGVIRGIPTVMIAGPFWPRLLTHARQSLESLERHGLVVQDGRTAAASVARILSGADGDPSPTAADDIEEFRARFTGARAAPDALREAIERCLAPGPASAAADRRVPPARPSGAEDPGGGPR